MGCMSITTTSSFRMAYRAPAMAAGARLVLCALMTTLALPCAAVEPPARDTAPLLDTASLLRPPPADLLPAKPENETNTFIVTYDGFHPRLETFNGANYGEELMVSFHAQQMRTAPASPLSAITTGELPINAVTTVKPQPVPTDVPTQPTTSPAALGGVLLLFCLLGYRRHTRKFRAR